LGKKVSGATEREILWKDFSAFNCDVFPDAPHKKSGKNVRQTMQALFKIQGLQVTKVDAIPSQRELFHKKIEAALTMLKRLGPAKAKDGPLPYTTKKLQDFSVDDVKDWLGGSGLKEYETAFTENAIDGPLLLSLTEEDLKMDLKVTRPLVIRKILSTIKTAKEEAEKKVAELHKKEEEDAAAAEALKKLQVSEKAAEKAKEEAEHTKAAEQKQKPHATASHASHASHAAHPPSHAAAAPAPAAQPQAFDPYGGVSPFGAAAYGGAGFGTPVSPLGMGFGASPFGVGASPFGASPYGAAASPFGATATPFGAAAASPFGMTSPTLAARTQQTRPTTGFGSMFGRGF